MSSPPASKPSRLSILMADINRLAYYGVSYFIEPGGPLWHRTAPIKGLLKEAVEGPQALPPGRALDVGCGSGRNSVYLATQGWHVTGVDVYGKPLRQARERARQAGVEARATFLKQRATQLDATPGQPFDLVLDVYAASGDLDPWRRQRYAQQVARVLRPGGVFLVFIWLEPPDVLPTYETLFTLERHEEGRDLGNQTKGFWYRFRPKPVAG